MARIYNMAKGVVAVIVAVAVIILLSLVLFCYCCYCYVAWLLGCTSGVFNFSTVPDSFDLFAPSWSVSNFGLTWNVPNRHPNLHPYLHLFARIKSNYPKDGIKSRNFWNRCLTYLTKSLKTLINCQTQIHLICAVEMHRYEHESTFFFSYENIKIIPDCEYRCHSNFTNVVAPPK